MYQKREMVIEEMGRLKGIAQVLKALQSVSVIVNGKYLESEGKLLQRGAFEMHKACLERVQLLWTVRRKIVKPKKNEKK